MKLLIAPSHHPNSMRILSHFMHMYRYEYVHLPYKHCFAMDAKITLSFDAAVADKAKAFAEANNISLSRLVEFMLSKVADKRYRSIDELPVSDWVNAVAEGEVQYVRKNAARNVKQDYLESRRK
jgi:antitoxin component of RelBE/YafQ-DinJ toxin-antitoxin module